MRRKNHISRRNSHFKFHFKFQIIRFDCALKKKKKGKLCRSFLTKFNIFERDSIKRKVILFAFVSLIFLEKWGRGV